MALRGHHTFKARQGTDFEKLNNAIDALKRENEVLRRERDSIRDKRYDLLLQFTEVKSENYRLTAIIAKLKAELTTGGNILSDELELIACLDSLKQQGITKYEQFKESLSEVVDAILNKTLINDVDISTKVKDPDFRFITELEPLLSLKVSELLALEAKPLREFSTKGRQQRSTNADTYARNIHDTIQNVLEQQPVKSLREAARVLNEQKIPTPLKGEWQPQTLKQLNNRWETLGLTKLPLIEKKPLKGIQRRGLNKVNIGPL
jgi:hypothetical protein